VPIRDVLFIVGLVATLVAALIINDVVVERRVEAYLQDHPEIVTNIIAKANMRRSAASAALMHRTLQERWKELSTVHGYAVRFNGSQITSRLVRVADVATPNTLNLVATDYRCGYCKRDREAVDALLRANPDRDFVFIEAPLLGPESIELANQALLKAQRGDVDYYTIHNHQFDVPAKEIGAKEPDIDLLAEQKRFLDTVGVFATPTYIRDGAFRSGALGTTPGG
jgi:hypothetical protein